LEDDVITKPLMQTIPLTNLNMATQLCKMLQVILTDELEIKNPQVGGWVVGLGLGIHEQIHKIMYLFKDLFSNLLIHIYVYIYSAKLKQFLG
jgi:hypothetical protein